MADFEPTTFLRETPPFCDLPKPLFDVAAKAIEVRSFPAGKRIVERGGAPPRPLYVIREGVVRLEDDGHVLQILEEGEVFGYTSLLTKRATMDVVVEEDLVACLLPGGE